MHTTPGASVQTLTPSLIRQLADELGLQPTKKLGQNFVHDAGTVRKIAQIAKVEPGQSVLEIGPGLGSLTLALLERGAIVTAVEIDRVLAAALAKTMNRLAPQKSTNLHVVNQDGLALRSWQSLGVSALPATKLVANLPYNVSVPLLLNAVQVFPSLEQAVVMVQAEVADRLVAAPGSRIYGAPTVKLAWYGRAEFAGLVSRNVFWPQPNVDSALVAWHRGGARGSELLRRATFKLVDLAFSQRRKMIRTPLREWLNLATKSVLTREGVGSEYIDPGALAEKLCEEAQVLPTSRAESLTIDDYVRLGEAVLHLQAEYACLAQIVVQLVSESEWAAKVLAGQMTQRGSKAAKTVETVVSDQAGQSKESVQIVDSHNPSQKEDSRQIGASKTVSASAPGKVNLVLHSSKRGEDGYHQLATIFEALSLREIVHCQLADKFVNKSANKFANNPANESVDKFVDKPDNKFDNKFDKNQSKYQSERFDSCSFDDSIVVSISTVAYLPDGNIDVEATATMLGVPREQHLAVRSAELLAEYAKTRRIGRVSPVHLAVKKQVPIAGGMAGGSADAAATLVALNQLWDLHLSPNELEVLGRKLGADVPACLLGGICVGVGRGDQMSAVAPGMSESESTSGSECEDFTEPVSDSTDSADCASPALSGSRSVHWWVLAVPEVGLSTPAVFQAFDSAGLGREKLPNFSSEFLSTTKADVFELAKILENDLQEATLSLRPELAKIGEIALEAGALQWIVSGSGPTIAALAGSLREAKKIQAALYQARENLAEHGCVLKTVVVAWGPAQGTTTVDLCLF